MSVSGGSESKAVDTPLVEPLSLDGAFLDLIGTVAIFGHTAEIGRRIKQRIRSELHLVASVGVASNKFVAKIASDLKKPDAGNGLEQTGPSSTYSWLEGAENRRLSGSSRIKAAALSSCDEECAETGGFQCKNPPF